MRILILFGSVLLGLSSYTQEVRTDEFPSFDIPKSTAYVDSLNKYSFQLLLKKPTQAIPIINYTLSLSDSLGYKDGKARALINKGGLYWSMGLADLALRYYFEAEALEPNLKNRAAIYNNIAEVYKKRENYDSAIRVYRKGIRFISERDKKAMPPMLIYNLGECYLYMDELDSARHYISISYEMGLESNDSRVMAYGLNGKGEIAARASQWKQALRFFRSSLKIRFEIEDGRGMIQSYYQLASVLKNLNVADSARYYYQKGINQSKQSGTVDLEIEGYFGLSKLEEANSNYQESLTYHKRYHELSDSLSGIIFSTTVNEVKSALQADVISTENALLVEKNQRIANESNLRNAILTAVSILIVLSVISYYQYRQRKQALANTANNKRIIDALHQLSKLWTTAGFEHFIDELLSISVQVLKVDNACFWKFDSDHNEIKALNLLSNFEKKPKRKDAHISTTQIPGYISALNRERVIAVNNISDDPIFANMHSHYFGDSHVKSLLDVEIRSEDNFIGILSFHVSSQEREWTLSEKRFASSLSNIVSSAFFLEQNRALLVRLFAKNEQLKRSAHRLSHEVREPLAQILGFTELAKHSPMPLPTESFYHIEQAAQKIDEVLRNLTEDLHSEEITL